MYLFICLYIYIYVLHTHIHTYTDMILSLDTLHRGVQWIGGAVDGGSII